MYRIILLFIMTAFLSPAAFADGSANDLATIQAHTDHLNSFYPQLSVVPNVSQPKVYPKVIHQLDLLESYLQGDIALKQGELSQLQCRQCVCTGCAQR
jgi:hypothetical protein